GLARSSRIGSTRIRTPSISSSIDECPNHVTRSPLTGARRYTRTSVRKGPSGTFGSRSALFLKYSGRTLKTSPNPPSVVGTGFRYRLPRLFARSNSPIEFFDPLTRAADSSPLRQKVERIRQLHAPIHGHNLRATHHFPTGTTHRSCPCISR